MDIPANIIVTDITFSAEVNNIDMQGTVSQNLYLGLSFDFISKNGYLLVIC